MEFEPLLSLSTICLGRWRLAEKMGIELIDVTIKSKDLTMKKLFAPPNFQLVMDFKTGKISREEYEEAYYNKLKHSSSVYYKEWMELFNKDAHYALACYCGDIDQCHRLMLVNYIIDFCNENDIDVEYLGEIEKDE